ncbi:teneurin-m isoform X2, variant 2 [Balamuthia mandrillaris]
MAHRCFVLVMLLFFCRCGETAQMRWRTPGISGSWDDPTNWIAMEDGAARVPTKYDDVVLGHEFDLRYLGAYTITVHREGTPVEVNSLSMESLDYCAPKEYHVWNGSQYREISLEETTDKLIRTGVLLDVVAPTTLVVHHPGEAALSFGKNAFVRLSGSKRDPWAMPQLAFVGGGTLAVYSEGELTGNGHIIGNVKMYLHSTIRPLVWWKGLPYPDEQLLGGTIHVYGNLSLNWVTLEMFVNGYERNMFSQIRVDGELYTLPSGDLFSDDRSANRLMVSTGSHWVASSFPSPSKSPSLVIYQSITGANGTGAIRNSIFNVTELPMQPIKLEKVKSCDNQPSEQTYPGNPAQCQHGTSRHDLSFLLSSQSNQNECPEASCPGTPPCSGRGTCEDGYCICDQGWADLDCTTEDCPGYPDCNGHGYCVINNEGQPICDCLPGWNGDDCGKARCQNDCTDEEHGYCDSSFLLPQCVCHTGFTLGPEKDCSLPFLRCPGLNEECSGFGECNRTTGSCSCHANRIGSDCSIPSCPPTQCSHHGECTWDALLNTSRCQCDEGWAGEDCSAPSLDCSSPEACSGHGVCVLDLDPPRCLCDGPKDFLPSSVVPSEDEARGWTGEECEVLVMDCASEESRCGSRCGNNEMEGFGCMMNECPLGWKGWDCNTPVCLDTGNPECHGHGRCVGPQDKSSPPQCQCREGWLPPDCRFRLFPLSFVHRLFVCLVTFGNQQNAAWWEKEVKNVRGEGHARGISLLLVACVSPLHMVLSANNTLLHVQDIQRNVQVMEHASMERASVRMIGEVWIAPSSTTKESV